MGIHEKIRAFISPMTEHHRYRSWEHCYGHFHQNAPKVIAADRDYAALQLGFYLASWGMFRGSGFFLRHAYTVHRGAIDVFVMPQFSILREREAEPGEDDTRLVQSILRAADAIRRVYEPFALESGFQQVSDTLVTKVILGTFGCLPACDSYFIKGWRREGLTYSHLDTGFVEKVFRFCRKHLLELRREQKSFTGGRLGGSVMILPLSLPNAPAAGLVSMFEVPFETYAPQVSRSWR